MGLAAWRGFSEGKKQWQDNAEATADAEFARCQTYLFEKNWFLAAAACREAGTLNPGYPGADEGYATAVAALTPEVISELECTLGSISDRIIQEDWVGQAQKILKSRAQQVANQRGD